MINEKARIRQVLLPDETVDLFIDTLIEEFAVTPLRVIFTHTSGHSGRIVSVPYRNLQAVEITDGRGMSGSIVRLLFGGDWREFKFPMKDSPGQVYRAILKHWLQ